MKGKATPHSRSPPPQPLWNPDCDTFLRALQSDGEGDLLEELLVSKRVDPNAYHNYTHAEYQVRGGTFRGCYYNGTM